MGLLEEVIEGGAMKLVHQDNSSTSFAAWYLQTWVASLSDFVTSSSLEQHKSYKVNLLVYSSIVGWSIHCKS